MRDTRATELATAQWRPEGAIKEITRDPKTGWVSILTTESIGFAVAPEFATARMEVGEEVAMCGAFGRPIQGVRVGGRLVFFKTEADLAADHQRFLDDLREKRRKEYDESHERWRASLAALPPPLHARMDRFIADHGGFEAFFRDDGGGSYELFCCTEAVKFADYFGRRFAELGITAQTKAAVETEVRRFRDLDPKEQRALVPYDDGHSGNTFGGALMLGVRVALGQEV